MTIADRAIATHGADSPGDHQKALEIVPGGAGPTPDMTIANTCAMLPEMSIP